MSEELLTKHIQGIIDSITKDRKKLEQTVTTAEKKGKTLIQLFSKEGEYPEFDDPEKFWNGLADLSEQIGHAQYMVLEIENKRRGLTVLMQDSKKKKSAGQTTQPIVFQATPAVVQQPGGLTGWLGARTMSKSQEKIRKMEIKEAKEPGVPKIVTEEKVLDILEFGRQLIPEFNRLHLYFQQCLDHLHFFSDDETKAFFHGELRTHLNKLTGIIRSFCRTVAEYRKAMLDEIKMWLAKGMTDVVVASMVGAGHAKLSELYKAIRDERGPTEF